MRGVYLIIIALTIAACNNGSTKQPVKQVAVKPIQQVDPAQNHSGLPVNDTLSPVKILTQGDFHDDELSKQDGKLSWIGIFKCNSGYYLAPFQIKITRVMDIYDSTTGPMTGWKVKTGKKDPSILLIGGLPLLQPHEITPLIAASKEMRYNEYLDFAFRGVTYKIYAKGNKKTLSGPDDFLITNYKLYIKATINGVTYDQLLASVEQAEYGMTILFAGDIDGDDIPDLIINTTYKENVEIPTLYLSKPAAKGQLLKMMGMHVTVGC